MEKIFNKWIGSVAVIITVVSFPISYLAEKKYFLATLITIALIFYFILYGIAHLIREFQRVFIERTSKIEDIDLLSNLIESRSCKNLCKTELNVDLQKITHDLDKLNRLNDVGASVDIVPVGTNVYKCIIITYTKESREYELEIVGPKARHVKVSHVPILESLQVGKSELESRDDISDSNGTKKIFRLVTHQGINLCQLQLSKINKEDQHISIDFIIKHKDNVVKKNTIEICS